MSTPKHLFMNSGIRKTRNTHTEHTSHDQTAPATESESYETSCAVKAASEHAKFEHAQRDFEALSKSLEKHSIVSVTDAKGKIIKVNNAFCAISGYSRKELIGQDHRLINSGYHDKKFWSTMWRTIMAGKPWRGEVCNRAKDGSLYWVDSIIAPFSDADGKLESIVSIRNDITPRKRGELSLHETSSRLSQAVQIGNLGVWDWDLNSGLVHWDTKMFEIYGLAPSPDGLVEYATWTATLDPDDLATQEAILHDTIARGGRSEREFRIRRPDGTTRVIQAADLVRLNDRGRPTSVVGVNRDITIERESQARLKNSLAIIERQNVELSVMAERAHRVVDDVSHEFRTPLSVIKEFASIIADGLAGPVTPEQASYLKIMDGAVMDLNHMVEDLLDSSKLRAGRLRVDRRAHDVAKILTSGRSVLSNKASARSIVIEERIDPCLPLVFADEEKIRRVVGNLMTNAIKFSPERASIILGASCSEQPDEVMISVTDHGPGLTPEEMDRLFGRFQQVSTSRTVAAKGFGLGLSIAQELAWLNLGSLSVRSEKGEGATFYFTLPINQPESVLEHYLRTIRTSENTGEEIAVLRAEVECPIGNSEPDEPQSFLASVTYATDLIYPIVLDQCDASTEQPPTAFWIIGRTKSAEAWTDRLRRTRSQLMSENQIDLAPLRIEMLGHWSFKYQLERGFEDVKNMIIGEQIHVS
ncbi:MAG: PAS domain S-box protein [Phycisphaeraceae bacterium]|nr:PAS domain S-box protein [Phycisphaeraceae bacterium]MCW5762541.1 PAS domain S-box protein [Phycisphaeraceae bacterium]